MAETAFVDAVVSYFYKSLMRNTHFDPIPLKYFDIYISINENYRQFIVYNVDITSQEFKKYYGSNWTLDHDAWKKNPENVLRDRFISFANDLFHKSFCKNTQCTNIRNCDIHFPQNSVSHDLLAANCKLSVEQTIDHFRDVVIFRTVFEDSNPQDDPTPAGTMKTATGRSPHSRCECHAMLQVKLLLSGWSNPFVTESDDCCSICLCKLISVNALVTPCGHTFHDSCILRLMANPDLTKNCPMCRAVL